jgi:SSS family solute:Na+ symporter
MIALVLIILFIVLLIAAGFWGMRKTTSLSDFFIGGRSIGPWISAFAFGTSYFSAVVFIGFAGTLGWGFGLNVLWIAIGNAVFGSLLAWLVLGRRTRTMSQNLDAITMPEFLQARYGGKYLKIISATIIFMFLLPYSASIFKGIGYLFEVNLNISFDAALLLIIVITGIYLILGGYFAVMITDFIQGFVMLFGAVCMVVILAGKSGGFVNTVSQISANFAVHTQGAAPNYFLLACIVFMTSFGVWGMPQMIQKFYSIKNVKVIKLAAWATFIFALIISLCAYFTGAMTHIFFDAVPLSGGKSAFDLMIPLMLTNMLPELLMAIILLLLLSASMSTLSSLVLVSASSIAIDLYKGHLRPTANKEHYIFMIRFLSGIFILISYLIARYEFTIIVTLMSLSWGVIAGSFTAAYVYGLYFKRGTLAGVTVSIASGFVTSIALFYILGPSKAPIASTVAILVPFIVLPVVSVFTKMPNKRLIVKSFKGV